MCVWKYVCAYTSVWKCYVCICVFVNVYVCTKMWGGSAHTLSGPLPPFSQRVPSISEWMQTRHSDTPQLPHRTLL